MKKHLYLVLSLLVVTNLSSFAQSNLQLGLEYLQASGKYTSGDLEDVTILSEHVSAQTGAAHVYLQQHYQGIPIKNAISTFNIKEGTVSWNAGDLSLSVNDKVNGIEPGITASQALQLVLQTHEIVGAFPAIVNQSSAPLYKTIFDRGEVALEDIKVQLVFFPHEEHLKLSWQVDVYEKSANHFWQSFVDAQSGELLEEYDQVIHCTFHPEGHSHSARAKAKQIAEITILKNAALVDNSYNVFAVPVESPNHGNRSIVVSPWDEAGDAGTLGWHDDGSSTYTVTRGNNVDAYEDQNNSNGPTGGDDARADGGINLEFDFPLDLTQDPEDDPAPYITNLFYWNNIMHDVFYQYGFDEASGNFQEDNLGRGGSGSDYVRAEAQDGGGTNNANFSTPVDGNRPRMQMYLWSPASGNFLEVNAPDNVAGSYEMEPAAFGGSLNDPTTGDVVEVEDDLANPSQGCNPLTNGGALSGNIALIDRGGCQFGTKCLNAQNAGAIAVVVCNDEPGLVTMGPGNDGDQVTIPAVMITQSDCTTLRAELDEGLNVTMQANPPLDGDLDNGIIAHEYGHGISIRLTGGANTSSCLNNAEQMGEGWSDFFGIWLSTEDDDEHFDVRGVGTYALGEQPEDDGIRPAPYTTDMTINDYTYGDIDNGNISQPHGVGFIWCTMIWDLNWAMINAHGFSTDFYFGNAGNNMTAQLILDGLKNQACSPGFVDGRDAILQADDDNNGGANENIIWNVFARRGVGYSADQGSSGSRFDQTEAFDLPPGVPFMDDEELFGSTALPVDFTNVTALPNQDEKQIELYWSTAFERNNAGYNIQRRSDNDADFETIGFVAGQINSTSDQSYVFVDDKVEHKLNYYYRLEQVDTDGTINYSKVVTARLDGEDATVTIFPNPTKGLAQVQLSESVIGQVELEVYNATGQLLGAQTIESFGNASIEINIANQAQGVYFINVKTTQGEFIKPIYLRK